MNQVSKSEDKIWSPRSSQSKCLKTGKEAFREQSKSADFTILDYWRWAYSDLLDNAARGVVAEFLVGHALKQTIKPRLEWGAFDFQTKSELKVEVKSAAYAQSWPQKKPSAIKFDIAPRSEVWNPETDKNACFNPPCRVADVYVFCLLGGPDDKDPDPIDLDKWEFYVLATMTLNEECQSQKNIALNPLKSLVQCTTGNGATPYCELAQIIEIEGKRS